jgi:ATP/maltotriose-dependent transcriptional regulator MalT
VAAHWFQRALAGQRARGDKRRLLVALLNLGDASYRLGRVAEASSLGAEASDLADTLNDTRLGCMVRSNLGQIDLLQGNADRAWRVYDEALALARMTRNDLLIADVLAGMAGVALAQKRLTECGLLLGASQAFCERFGSRMVPHHGLQRKTLDGLHASMPRETVDHLLAQGQTCSVDEAIDIVRRLEPHTHESSAGPNLAGLTERESTVLKLLASGMSNREIGADLSISHRTVMRHVAAIFRKLGVNNRAAAAKVALDQHLLRARSPDKPIPETLNASKSGIPR